MYLRQYHYWVLYIITESKDNSGNMINEHYAVLTKAQDRDIAKRKLYKFLKHRLLKIKTVKYGGKIIV